MAEATTAAARAGEDLRASRFAGLVGFRGIGFRVIGVLGFRGLGVLGLGVLRLGPFIIGLALRAFRV